MKSGHGCVLITETTAQKLYSLSYVEKKPVAEISKGICHKDTVSVAQVVVHVHNRSCSSTEHDWNFVLDHDLLNIAVAYI